MAGDERFVHESIQDTISIRKYFQALMEGFANGRILFSSEDTSLVMLPEGLLKLEIKAKRKEGHNRVELKINWKDGELGKKRETGVLRIDVA